jgi:hypothetical protein
MEGSEVRYAIVNHSMTNTRVRNCLHVGTGKHSATRSIHRATMLHEYQSMNDVTFGFLIHLTVNVNVMPGKATFASASTCQFSSHIPQFGG